MTPEQKRALALAAARRRRAEAEKKEAPRPGLLSRVNQGIASAVGAPVDLINAGLGALGVPVSDRPFGGSRSIASGMEALGIELPQRGSRPESVAEALAEGVGGAAGMLIPGAGLVGAASRAASPVTRAAAQTVARPFVETPRRAIAAELAAGAGAGAGAAIAEDVAPDNPAAEFAGSLAGGVVAGMAPSATVRALGALPGVQTARDFAAAQVAPFTQAGAMERARSRVGGLVEDPEAALAGLRENTIGELSPAVATGDRRLMGLEQAVRDQEAPIDLSMRQAETRASQTLREEAMAPGQGVSPDATRRVLSERIEPLVQQMEARAVAAQEAAQQRVAALSPQRRQAEASIAAREELEEAYRATRQQEGELWAAVPRETLAPTTGAKRSFRAIMETIPRAQRDNIPAKARDFLGDGNQTFRDQETVAEVHGLYSEMREAARIARADGRRNTARIADLVADALMDDISSVPASAQLRDALDFSREFNRVFRQGNIGRVLGSERTGGQSVAPELTLDTTIGQGGIRGAVAQDELEAALGVPSQAIPDYLLGRFEDATVRNGVFSPQRAETFSIRNRDLLERNPAVQSPVADALLAGETAERVGGTMANRISGVEAGAAARFLGSEPGAEISTILRSPEPGEMAKQLVRQVRRDETGQALSGLKSALADDLMAGARTRQFDEAGQPMLSGRAMKAKLADPEWRAVASEIMSPDELSRMDRIADEFARIETMQGRLPNVGPIMGDEPNSMISMMARFMAAQTSSNLSRGSGAGVSLQTAQMASSRMQRLLRSLTNDRAERLIIEAVSGDRDLFEALLQPSNALTRRQENRIIETWTGITGQQLASDDDDNVASALME